MDGSTCINCDLPFELRKKGFKRSLITKLGIPLIKITDILDKKVTIPCTSKQFLCNSCASLTVKIYKNAQKTQNKGKTAKQLDYNTEKKRKRTVFTPVKATPQKLAKRKCFKTSTPKFSETSKPSYLQKCGFKEKVYQYLKISRYDTVFKLLLKHSKIARDAMIKVVGKAIKKEVRNAKIPSFQKPENLDTFHTFTWRNAMKELLDGLPFLTNFIQESLCKKNKNAVVDDQGKVGPFVPALGFILGTILHIQKPLQHNFLQTIASVEMYRSGCNQKIFRWFQKLGWCKGIKGTRTAVDQVCKEFDTKIKTWKHSVELELGHPVQNHRPDIDQPMPESDSEISDGDQISSDSDSLDSEVNFSSEEDVEVFPLPSDDEDEVQPVPLDNSSLEVEDRHNQNPGYSICWDNVQKLSISRHHLRQENKMMLWALCFAAKNRISFRHLDRLDDKCSVRDIEMHNYLPSTGDWQLLRSRMEHVVKKILCKYFPQFSDMEVKDITHQYSEISEKKSEIVNLGVIQQNPSTARGTLEILKTLHQYVPQGHDGHPYPIVCHGDQLSVERMVEAKLSMAFSEDPDDQLTGLIPRPQGFHKRCIILQDSMNLLFDGRSVGDKGSLCHIKNKFGFRTVKKKISDCVNSVVDFFDFVTEASVCMIVCRILNINNIDDISDALPDDKIDRQTVFHELSEEVVRLAWPQVDKESIHQASTVADETLVPTDDQEDDHNSLEDTVLYWDDGHELEDTLPYYESEDEFDEPEAGVQESGDSVFNYSRCVLWRGLLHMAQTDAERRNNGDHMIADWRLDMVEFWNQNHYKYLILGHRLLAGVSGCLPPRLRNELIWNSTANLVGKPGHNIALDLVNEFLNNEFKSNLKNCHGQYTDVQVSRCSKIVGSIGKAIEEIFYQEVVKDHIPRAAATDGTSRSKIKKFIREYQGEDLFIDIGDRHHTGFLNFAHKIAIKNPEKLHARLQKYVKNLENEEYIYN